MLKPIQEEAYDQSKTPELVDSKKEQLDIGKIVVIASYHTKSEAPPNQVAMAILLELQQPNTIQQIIGNTLFIAHPSKVEGKYIFRALNADTVENYLESAKQFIRLMQENGATELATQFNDKRLLRFIKMVADSMVNEDNAPVAYRAFQKGDQYLVAITLVGEQQ